MHLLPAWLSAVIAIVGLALAWLLVHLVFVKPKRDRENRTKQHRARATNDSVESILRQLPQDGPADLEVVKRGHPADEPSDSAETTAAAEAALQRSRRNGQD